MEDLCRDDTTENGETTVNNVEVEPGRDNRDRGSAVEDREEGDNAEEDEDE
jgi:hypothetical protein